MENILHIAKLLILECPHVASAELFSSMQRRREFAAPKYQRAVRIAVVNIAPLFAVALGQGHR